MNHKCNGKVYRRTIAHWIRCGFRYSALSAATLLTTSPAWAQLRTGRDSDRDFYSAPSIAENQPTAVSKPTGKPQAKSDAASRKKMAQASANSSGVVQASAVEFSPAADSSRVVHAGCKNCQAGIAHSHSTPIASPTHNSIIAHENEGTVEEFGNEDMIFGNEPTRVAGSHDSCGSHCGSSMACDGFATVHPLSFLSQLLCRSQLRIEAATFWPDGQSLPQLVTSRRPANDPATDGLIGRSDTVNLFGGGESLGQSSQGIRGELGTYFDACRSHGVLVRFFDAGSNSESFSSSPTSEPVVMRPFFNSTNNAQATIAVNYPGSTSGSLDARISNELYGGDILFRKLILRDCAGRIEFLAGYQTARLADDLLISSTTTALTNTPAPQGTISELTDHFATTNRFNGMALGLSGIMRENRWSLSGMFKLGLGNMERSVDIDGSSTITVPGNPTSTNTTPSGLLARSTNDGNYVMNTFVVSPEVNATLGFRLTRRLEATVGYGYLGLPKVARVADQLDPQLASNLSNPLTGSIRPAFELAESNFSLHSLNYGLQWRY
jgi:hypothetical protein